jgi:hypothetical protein
MALFSRRPKVSADQPAAVELEAGTEAEVEVAVGEADQEAAEQAAVAASIDISVSSFRGLGAHVESPPRADAPAAPAVPTPHASARAEAPPRTETVPGVRDNVLVREALAGLSESPAPPELMNVARQLMQGHLFLRVKGDARALLAEGKGLPLAVGTVGDRSFALAYSGGAALQDSVRLDGDVDTSAMGQPVLVVLRHVLAGPSDGLIIDHASAPARAVLPRALSTSR